MNLVRKQIFSSSVNATRYRILNSANYSRTRLVLRMYARGSMTKATEMAKKPAPKKLDTAQQGAAAAAGTGNKEIAALAMAGADAWQKVIVYIFYGIISLALVYLSVPPYATDKFKVLLLI